jgi:hypothetical protein
MTDTLKKKILFYLVAKLLVAIVLKDSETHYTKVDLIKEPPNFD